MLDLLSGKRILIVAPHCDDEVLGCGGLLFSLRSQLAYVILVHVVNGELARQKESLKVRKMLQVDKHLTLKGIDGDCSSTEQDCTEDLAKIIQKETPDIVFSSHALDDHPDHMSTWKIVRNAARKARHKLYFNDVKNHRIKHIIAYEVWTPISNPSIWYDITPVIDKKCDAMKKYQTQIAEFPYIDYIKALNGWRGLLFQKEGYVETFEIHSI